MPLRPGSEHGVTSKPTIPINDPSVGILFCTLFMSAVTFARERFKTCYPFYTAVSPCCLFYGYYRCPAGRDGVDGTAGFALCDRFWH